MGLTEALDAVDNEGRTADGKRISAVSFDKAQMDYDLQQRIGEKKKDKIQISPYELNRDPYGIAMRHGETAQMEALNHVVLRWVGSSSDAAAQEKYFGAQAADSGSETSASTYLVIALAVATSVGALSAVKGMRNTEKEYDEHEKEMHDKLMHLDYKAVENSDLLDMERALLLGQQRMLDAIFICNNKRHYFDDERSMPHEAILESQAQLKLARDAVINRRVLLEDEAQEREEAIKDKFSKAKAKIIAGLKIAQAYNTGKAAKGFTGNLGASAKKEVMQGTRLSRISQQLLLRSSTLA